MELGLRMEELIFKLADQHLFFNDLEVIPRNFSRIAHMMVVGGECAIIYRAMCSARK